MYSQDVADKICARLAEGESLRQICDSKGMPNRETVRLWLADPERAEFLAKYARAREDQADTLVDDMADVEAEVHAGVLKPDAAKVILWSRQWRAEKLKPKAYGAKVTQEHTGAGGGPIQIIASDHDEAL